MMLMAALAVLSRWAINIKSTLASSLARLQDTNSLVTCNWHKYSLQQEIHRISNIQHGPAA
jgi:hypothetical protein